MKHGNKRTGDIVEAAAVDLARRWFDAATTRGSGSVQNDGDIAGIPNLFVECKGSGVKPRGRSVSKAEWKKAKHQADEKYQMPSVVGVDDDGELVAFIRFRDLLGLIANVERMTGG